MNVPDTIPQTPPYGNAAPMPHEFGDPDQTMHDATRAASALLGLDAEAPTPRRELSPEVIASIENLDTNAIVKTSYLLVALGEKPAASEHIQTPAKDDTMRDQAPPVMSDETISEHIKVAQDAGMSVHTHPQRIMPRVGGKQATIMELSLGSTPENARRLFDIAMAKPFDERAYGIALGYPETAVNAFSGGAATISASEVPGIEPEVEIFAGYKLSREHAQEELETARRWAQAVKAASPKIYEQSLAHTAWLRGEGPNPYL